MLLWLCFGFAPAPLPGPPVVHLERTVFGQSHLDFSPIPTAFRAAWGPAHIRWDERTGAPRFVGLPGIDEGDMGSLLGDVAALAGVPVGEFAAQPPRSRPALDGERTTWRFTRRWHGAEVVGDEVAFVATNGKLGAAWIRITPTRGLPEPRPGEVVIADPARGFGRLVRLRSTPSSVTAEDRAGAVVAAWDPRRFTDVTVAHEAETVGDALVVDAARGVTVTDASGAVATTADDGSHTLSGPLTVSLEGPTFEFLQNGASIDVNGTDEVALVAGDNVSWAAGDTLHHAHVVWDWLRDRWPTHTWLDGNVVATVDITSQSCNAYYSNSTLNFFAEGGGCNSMGRIASVVYHETGHGIHEYILANGTFATDVSEGSADYISATLLDDPEIGAGFYLDGSGIRELDTDRRYPDDVTGEPHNDGLIWASFLWDVRETWRREFGEETGTTMADELLLGALEQGPELTDLLEAVLVADDDDGDWSNGTPHDCQLIDLLDTHGLGPGALGVYAVSHAPLGAQASETEGYPVTIDLLPAFSTCDGIAPPTPSVWVTRDPHAPLPATDGTGWEPWSPVPLSTADGESWTGTLPRAPATSELRYFYFVTSADGTETAYSHSGLESEVYDFWVGDREPLWCEGFETDAPEFTHGAGIPWTGTTGLVDEWQFGPPSGDGRRDPDVPNGGAALAGTLLGADYTANNAEYLLSGPVDLTSPGRMRLLSYARWLGVEDGTFDHAGVYGFSGGKTAALWQNPATVGGSHQTLDTAWTAMDHDLSALLEPDGTTAGPLSFGFSLQSDPGLEFGGWNLDDLCVVQLADPADHYRRVHLTATSTESGVDLTWITPWMRPLSATLLVRQEGRAPAALTDGVIVDLDLSPEWGQPHIVHDALPGLDPGTSWTYAVFAVGRDDADVYEVAVEGENAATIELEALDTAPPEDTSAPAVDSGDSGEPATRKPDDSEAGCGCATTNSPAALALLLSIGLLTRRRRRE